MFDIKNFKNIKSESGRYNRQLDRLKKSDFEVFYIDAVVSESCKNLQVGVNSFVIYGEPQSGKTEMMICLTAKLLDEGKKVIIILLNDNVELLKQNLQRFKMSGIAPDPKNYTEIIDSTVEIGNSEWIIFCKKNAKDLRKLIDKLRAVHQKVVIDDEADYASPNAKKNQGCISKINELVGELLGNNGIYIGVTATPARLDLNNTFDNANNKWVNFTPHQHYTGQSVFFPINLKEKLSYCLNLLPDHGDYPKHLRDALFSFFVNVAYLNLKDSAKKEKNYCMLVHTSGKRADHTADYKNIIKTINVLKDESAVKYEQYVRTIWEVAQKIFLDVSSDEIVKYILRNISRTSIVVMNSDADKKNVDYSAAMNPTAPFTIAIGGNIVSRGVTFKNLLSMFFTRDVKHKIQQDTYIQRARMFGSRNEYINYFELSIPEHLFLDWHKCFVFHRLALESINSGNGVPVWIEDKRVSAVSSSSIDRLTVSVESGEMGFDVFDHTKEVEQFILDAYESRKKGLDVLKELNQLLGDKKIPQYIIDYIINFMPQGEQSVAFHKSFSIANYSDADQERIERPKGFIGHHELEHDKYPDALHHFKVFYNKDKKARIYYRYVGNIKFLKNLRNA